MAAGRTAIVEAHFRKWSVTHLLVWQRRRAGPYLSICLFVLRVRFFLSTQLNSHVEDRCDAATSDGRRAAVDSGPPQEIFVFCRTKCIEQRKTRPTYWVEAGEVHEECLTKPIEIAALENGGINTAQVLEPGLDISRDETRLHPHTLVSLANTP